MIENHPSISKEAHGHSSVANTLNSPATRALSRVQLPEYIAYGSTKLVFTPARGLSFSFWLTSKGI